MTKKFLSILEAAELSNKSVQTIRRAVKSKKLKSRRQKTPQGFNYMVSHDSLCKIYKLKIASAPKEEVAEAPKKVSEKVVKKEKTIEKKADDKYVTTEDFQNFAKTLERLVSQHSDERQNFVRLISTLQEKIFVLENQLNLLSAPGKSWYQFWK